MIFRGIIDTSDPNKMKCGTIVFIFTGPEGGDTGTWEATKETKKETRKKRAAKKSTRKGRKKSAKR